MFQNMQQGGGGRGRGRARGRARGAQGSDEPPEGGRPGPSESQVVCCCSVNVVLMDTGLLQYNEKPHA